VAGKNKTGYAPIRTIVIRNTSILKLGILIQVLPDSAQNLIFAYAFKPQLLLGC